MPHHRASPPSSLHHYAAKHPHQETSNNTNINLKGDKIQHKKAATCDKENAFVAVVKENQWWSKNGGSEHHFPDPETRDLPTRHHHHAT